VRQGRKDLTVIANDTARPGVGIGLLIDAKLVSMTSDIMICALLGANSAIAQQIEDKLVIVTSFSKDVTSPFQQACEKKYPGTKVEVQNRNSAAAIAFIRETRSSPPDIFWASAPDAFAFWSMRLP